jgi:hypothetical protein
MRVSTNTPRRDLAAPGSQLVSTGTVKRGPKTSLLLDRHAKVICLYVRFIQGICGKKLLNGYAFITHMGVVCARAVHTFDSSNDLLASHTCCLPFFLQIALDRNGLCTPRCYCICKKLYRRSDRRFRQEKGPRSFDIGVSKIWPCASQKPTRLTTEKSGSSPSSWDHNHTSVEEQDLCTIQASHGILHKKKIRQRRNPQEGCEPITHAEQ